MQHLTFPSERLAPPRARERPRDDRAERAAREVLAFDGVPACASAGATLAAAAQLMQKGLCQHPLCIFAGRKTYE